MVPESYPRQAMLIDDKALAYDLAESEQAFRNTMFALDELGRLTPERAFRIGQLAGRTAARIEDTYEVVEEPEEEWLPLSDLYTFACEKVVNGAKKVSRLIGALQRAAKARTKAQEQLRNQLILGMLIEDEVASQAMAPAPYISTRTREDNNLDEAHLELLSLYHLFRRHQKHDNPRSSIMCNVGTGLEDLVSLYLNDRLELTGDDALTLHDEPD